MPITIIDPGNGVVWPGVQINAFTDIVGPLPVTDEWWISVTDPVTEAVQLQQRFPTFGQKNLAEVLFLVGTEMIQSNSPTLTNGANARLLVELRHQDLTVVESASVAVKWDAAVSIPLQLQALPQATGGGLTSEQAEQLANVDLSSSLAALTDALLLTELTTGPTGDPLVVPLVNAIFGVIVRLSTIPEGLVPQTPDQQYWTKTLAVVRVFRGNDLWIRAPIHTPTKIVAFEREGLTIWVPNLTLTTWLLNMRLLVDWLPGVTGRVYQMHFP